METYKCIFIQLFCLGNNIVSEMQRPLRTMKSSESEYWPFTSEEGNDPPGLAKRSRKDSGKKNMPLFWNCPKGWVTSNKISKCWTNFFLCFCLVEFGYFQIIMGCWPKLKLFEELLRIEIDYFYWIFGGGGNTNPNFLGNFCYSSLDLFQRYWGDPNPIL